jgi:hypothetical protein
MFTIDRQIIHRSIYRIHNTKLDLWDIRNMNTGSCTEIYTQNRNANITSDTKQYPLQQPIVINEASILGL